VYTESGAQSLRPRAGRTSFILYGFLLSKWRWCHNSKIRIKTWNYVWFVL